MAEEGGDIMNSNLYDPAFWSRIQFAFTITYHYLFPQLTMGLAWFLVYWKWRALRTGDEKYNQAVRFWAKIFGLNFAVGVVTGIPMEFQFGTNWAGFSRYAGRRHRTDAGDGGHVRVLSRKRLRRRAHLGRKATGSALSLPGRAGGRAGKLAFRLLHYRDKRVHAASGGLPHRSGWLAGHRQSQRLPAESMGVGPVRPQSDGGARNGLVRGGGRGRTLYLARTPSGAGATVSRAGTVHRR